MAPRDLYAGFCGTAPDAERQAIGGMLMLIIGTPVYLLAGVALAARAVLARDSGMSRLRIIIAALAAIGAFGALAGLAVVFIGLFNTLAQRPLGNNEPGLAHDLRECGRTSRALSRQRLPHVQCAPRGCSGCDCCIDGPPSAPDRRSRCRLASRGNALDRQPRGQDVRDAGRARLRQAGRGLGRGSLPDRRQWRDDRW